ncbi:MAG: hypothetical protein DRI44_07420 [Chlamydiae bacterium]|nr:MAG: hypothetical protein DRI44_07420 [Chlamydiota bacterium]
MKRLLFVVFICNYLLYAYSEKLPSFESRTPLFTRISLSKNDDTILKLAYDSEAGKCGVIFMLKNKNISVNFLPGNKSKKLNKIKLIKFDKKYNEFDTVLISPLEKANDELLAYIKLAIKGEDNDCFFSHILVYVNDNKDEDIQWIYYYKGCLETADELTQSPIFRYYKKPEFKIKHTRRNIISINLSQKNSKLSLLSCKKSWGNNRKNSIQLTFTKKNWAVVKKDSVNKLTVGSAQYEVNLNTGKYYMVTSMEGGPLWNEIAATNIVIVKQKLIGGTGTTDIKLLPFKKSKKEIKVRKSTLGKIKKKKSRGNKI